jgi:hypothetical protein
VINKFFEIRRYIISDAETWNNFVVDSKNGTFLFDRKYMEHHQNNFDDFSLIVTKNQKWVAILPANVSGNVVHSHQYLTYGGLVFKDDVKQIEVVEILKIILIFLEKNALEKLVLKIIPAIYHKKPSDDLEYALWLAKATLVGRDCLKVMDLQKKSRYQKPD